MTNIKQVIAEAKRSLRELKEHKGESTHQKRARYVPPVDEHAARDLQLFAESTGKLYDQKKRVLKNLQGHYKRGNYDPEKAVVLWMHWVDAAAREYIRENKPGVAWNIMFPKSTRLHVARELEEQFRVPLQHGDW